MAKGKKTGGRDFIPGDERAGRPKKPEELRRLEKLTKSEVIAKLAQFLKMNVDELQVILEDKALPVIDHWVGRVALMGIKNGDHQRLNFLFDRLIGKVSDKLEVTLPKPTVIVRPNGEQVVLGSEDKLGDE